jgi:hypothetical protein
MHSVTFLYCNARIRDNILFGLPFNETWYRRVIKACCLVLCLSDCQGFRRDCQDSQRDCHVSHGDCHGCRRDCHVSHRDCHVSHRHCHGSHRDCHVSHRDCQGSLTTDCQGSIGLSGFKQRLSGFQQRLSTPITVAQPQRLTCPHYSYTATHLHP